MDKNSYIGHSSQVSYIEEHILNFGKAKGTKILEVNNGQGLFLTLNMSRCMDIVRLTVNGKNVSYISPCGIVSPEYCVNKQNEFLKSFTAGFLTTCGLTTFGTTSIDNGEELPLHGTISSVPVDTYYYENEEKYLRIVGKINDSTLFAHHLQLERTITVYKDVNSIEINDKVINNGKDTPLMILYHFNIGFPMLNEHTVLNINSYKKEKRTENVDLSNWNTITAPLENYEEECIYHYFNEEPFIELYSPISETRMRMSYDHNSLPYFIEWKMLGINEYVLGLEPANSLPDGRKSARQKGILDTLKRNETREFKVKIDFK